MTEINIFIMIENFLSTILMLQGEQFSVVIVALIFTILAAIFFAKILKNFSMFSSGVSTVMGLGLAIILVLTGIVRSLILFLTTKLGFIGATLVLLIFFVVYFILQIFIDKKLRKDKALRRKIEAEKGEEYTKALFKAIEKGRK